MKLISLSWGILKFSTMSGSQTTYICTLHERDLKKLDLATKSLNKSHTLSKWKLWYIMCTLSLFPLIPWVLQKHTSHFLPHWSVRWHTRPSLSLGTKIRHTLSKKNKLSKYQLATYFCCFESWLQAQTLCRQKTIFFPQHRPINVSLRKNENNKKTSQNRKQNTKPGNK